MANICNLKGQVRGKRENILSLFQALKRNGQYWIGRGAFIEVDNTSSFENDDFLVEFSGLCKWSIATALFNSAVKMREIRESGKTSWMFNGIDPDTITDFLKLDEACAKFRVNIELYSEGSDMGFQEHYVIINGEIVTAENVEWREYWFSNYKKMSYETFIEYLNRFKPRIKWKCANPPKDTSSLVSREILEEFFGIDLSDKEFSEGVAHRGGFKQEFVNLPPFHRKV